MAQVNYTEKAEFTLMIPAGMIEEVPYFTQDFYAGTISKVSDGPQPNKAMMDNKTPEQGAGLNIVLDIEFVHPTTGKKLTMKKYLPVPTEYDTTQTTFLGQNKAHAKAEVLFKYFAAFTGREYKDLPPDQTSVKFEKGQTAMLFINETTSQAGAQMNEISMAVDPKPLLDLPGKGTKKK